MKDCARIVLVYEIRMSACNLGVRVGSTIVNIGIILSGEPSRRLVVFLVYDFVNFFCPTSYFLFDK